MSNNSRQREQAFRDLQAMSADGVRNHAGKVLTQLRSRWPEVRIAAVEALDRARVEGTTLREAAMHEKNDVVLAAMCEALMDFGDRGSIPILKKLAQTHTSALVRRKAVWAVAEVLGRDAIAFLRRRENAERSNRVKATVRSALVKNGVPQKLPALLAMLQSRDYIVRASIANFFAQNVVVRKEDRGIVVRCLREALDAEQTRAASDALARALTAVQG